MAHHKSAKKRIVTNEKARRRNQRYLVRMRSAIRAVNDSQDKGEAEGNYVKAQAVIDKLVSKGIIHRNQGAKRKSRLARRVAKFA